MVRNPPPGGRLPRRAVWRDQVDRDLDCLVHWRPEPVPRDCIHRRRRRLRSPRTRAHSEAPYQASETRRPASESTGVPRLCCSFCHSCPALFRLTLLTDMNPGSFSTSRGTGLRRIEALRWLPFISGSFPSFLGSYSRSRRGFVFPTSFSPICKSRFVQLYSRSFGAETHGRREGRGQSASCGSKASESSRLVRGQSLRGAVTLSNRRPGFSFLFPSTSSDAQVETESALTSVRRGRFEDARFSLFCDAP